MLSIRHVNDYPWQGFDIVPEQHKHKPNTLSDLVKLLREANKREEATNEHTDWNIGIDLTSTSSKRSIKLFTYKDLCLACKWHKDKIEACDTICLCKGCSTVDKTWKSLELKLEKSKSKTQLLARVSQNLIEWIFRTWQKWWWPPPESLNIVFSTETFIMISQGFQ